VKPRGNYQFVSQARFSPEPNLCPASFPFIEIDR